MRFRTTRGLATRGPATVAALAAVLGLVAAACGGATNPGAGTSTTKGSATSTGGGAAALPAGMPGKGKPAVVVGDKNFSEEYVLGDLYSQALRDKGYTVSVKSDIGSSEIIDAAFSSGKIDLYPEYTGEIVATLAHEQLPNSSEGTYAAAKKWEEQHRGATLLAQTPFQDVDTVVVKPAFAKKYKLTTVADLDHVGPHGKGVVFGGPPTFQHRAEGLVGMQKVYGLTAVKFVSLSIGLTYIALDKGSINAGDGFSTDGQLVSGRYVALEDPQHIFGFQHVAPVVKRALLQKEGPAFSQTLDWVTSKLTTKAIQAMNAAVQLSHDDPAAVATAFLKANGLS